MKKNWWFLPVALLAVFGLFMTGCPNDGDGDKSLKIKLVKNEYGNKDEESGLIVYFRPTNLLNGKQIAKGDTFEFKLVFTLDKALDSDMYIGFLDNTPEANYWRELAWSHYIPSKDLVANTEITREFTLTADNGSSSTDPQANTLVIQCGDPWSKAPVTMTFSKFVINNGKDLAQR